MKVFSGLKVAVIGCGLIGKRRIHEDAVVVATHNGMLAEITMAALVAGKHVLVEKPMGRNLAEAQKMLAAARSAQRVLKIGFNHRYHPAIAKAYQRYWQYDQYSHSIWSWGTPRLRTRVARQS